MLLPHETEIVARLLYETRQSARKILDLPTHPLTWDELDDAEQAVYARMAEAMEQHVCARAALAKRWLAGDSALGFFGWPPSDG